MSGSVGALAKIESPVLSREYGDAMNYLISPVHPQFGRLVWGETQSFRFDPSLIATEE